MKKLRKQAKELLHAASRVYHYRKDVLSGEELQALESAVDAVSAATKGKSAEPGKLQGAMENLDGLLHRIGGKIYPKTFWNDNIEVVLVAAILVIGIRTFFFQPFIIPTNSMYPTYSGMNSVVYDAPAQTGPSLPVRLLRFITLGAKHKSLTAANSGKVELLYHLDRFG
ncbi:MAG: S26 family signal peptidase, partial [Coraliomargarita sp.]